MLQESLIADLVTELPAAVRLQRLISTLRSSRSQEAYRSIGGGSPLRRITEHQARELQSTLRQRGIEATSYVAMRYWHPFTESAVADIKADDVDEVVVLPAFAYGAASHAVAGPEHGTTLHVDAGALVPGIGAA